MLFVIDIDPVAFRVLGIPVRWYGLILVGAAAVAIWFAQRESAEGASRRRSSPTPSSGSGQPRSSAGACSTSSRTSSAHWPSSRHTSSWSGWAGSPSTAA